MTTPDADLRRSKLLTLILAGWTRYARHIRCPTRSTAAPRLARSARGASSPGEAAHEKRTKTRCA